MSDASTADVSDTSTDSQIKCRTIVSDSTTGQPLLERQCPPTVCAFAMSLLHKLTPVQPAFRFLDLAIELQLLVFEASEKNDLKNLRMASKGMATIGAVTLFRELTIQTRYMTTGYAHRTAFNFGRHVRSLRVTTSYYCPCSFEQFIARFATHPHLPAICRDRLHQIQAYNKYNQLRDKYCTNRQRYSIYPQSCDLIKFMTTLQKVLVTDGVYEVESQDYFCWLLDCNLEDELARTQPVIPPTSGLRTPGVRLLGSILSAIRRTKAPVEELVVSSTGDMLSGSLSTDAFYNNQEPLDFDMLTKLHLEVHPLSRKYIPIGRATTSVSCEVCLARNLRYLSLATPPNFPAMSLKDAVGECIFPRLRSCILLNFKATYKDICDFTKHIGDLQHLCLHVFDLLSGTWKLALEALKDNLPRLRDVYLDRLYGRFGPQEMGSCLFHSYSEDAGYQDHAALIEQYLVADGTNPFDLTFFELTTAQVKYQQRRKGLGILDRCRKYHGAPLNDCVAN
ncbi:MAG: hypothetical protein Q9226_005723 [Calogaya cf. arnoldii]